MAGAALKSPPRSPSVASSETGGFGVPIALLNFNRPQMTRRVFEVVRQIRPRRLLLIADGPRASKPDDVRLCAEVRAIFDEIDWDCEVSRKFSDTNLGSFQSNSRGLTWVFDTVEEAIILEDDCVPSLSFFPYCEELLERYRGNPKVGLISGNNLDFPKGERESDSYYFSVYNFTWGWASWRQVWQEVDLSMSWWESESGKEMLRAIFARTAEWQHWHELYESIRNGKRRNAWDYQLLLSCFRHARCGVIPRINLVSNMGFGIDATHCKDEFSPLHAFPRGELAFPLGHPSEIQRSIQMDDTIFRTFIRPPTLWQRVINKVARVIKRAKKQARDLLA